MFQRILVPLDGSSRAERAIPIAARLAQATGGSITLLRVVTHPHDAVVYLLQPPEKADAALEEQHAEAVGYLSRLSGSCELADVETTMNVADSNPAQTILSAVQLQQMDSIVMCSHGTTGFMRWALGSVAQKVVRHSTVPVLLLREGETLHALLQPQDVPHPLRVIVALDGSALAETALQPAASLCAALSTPAQGEIKLTLVLTGVENEQQGYSEKIKSMKDDAEAYLETVKLRHQGELARFQVRITSSVVLGVDAADTLIRVAENKDDEKRGGSNACDMIAMATHGRDGTALLTMGSVTERVLEATSLLLLIVQP